MRSRIWGPLALTAAVALAACGGGGGGGGDSSPPPAVTSFNLDSALKALVASGQSFNASVSNSNACTGTASLNTGPANTDTTFEGQPAWSSTSVINVNFSDCTPSTFSNTTLNYYTKTYLPLGIDAQGGDYLLVDGTANVPATVEAGDVGIVANLTRYDDSTKAVQTGTGQISYVVTTESATSAIVELATKAYTASGALESTQLTRYRIDAESRLTLLSLKVQLPDGYSITFTRT